MSSAAQSALAFILLSLAAPTPALCVSLSLPSPAAGPGASVPVSVSFASHGESVAGLQFDLVLDDPALSLAIVTGDATRSSAKSLYVAPLASNRTRFLICGFNQEPISDGTIAILFVNIASGAALGVYPMRFVAALATGPAGNAVQVSTSDGSITIQSAYSVPVVSEGVLNGGSLLPGPVAPGEVITIMGSAIGPPTFTDPNITFDGLRAPLLYASANQVNAVVPFGIAGRTAVAVDIANSSGPPISIVISAAPAAPAIFTLTGNGAGPGAILNQDSTVNSPDNPALRGSIIVIFATGAGQTDPPGEDETFPLAVLPKPLLPVAVTVGGEAAEILYAGAAPTLISGVLQVNCRVPVQIAPGNAVPVVLKVGDQDSPPVTVAVR